MHWSSLVLAFCAVAGVSASPSRYNLRGGPSKYQGVQVVRVNLDSRKDVAHLKAITNGLKLDTWESYWRPGGAVDVVVPKQHVKSFTTHVSHMNIKTMHKDLGASIAQESPRKYGFVHAAAAGNSSFFADYHPYQEHLDFLTDLNKKYPSNTEIVIAGKSTEGKDITGIHIWGKEKGKPAAIFHGNVHAREWITSMVTNHYAEKLAGEEGAAFTEHFDFHIFPIVNPDGFVHTQDENGDRMWRKNRQDVQEGKNCGGTDINRNWGFKWDVEGGASDDPCDETFRGKSAESASETKGLADYIRKLKGARIYMDTHSYSQILMSPWGYNCDETTPDDPKFQKLLGGWSEAIKKVHGTEFKYGPTCQTIYQTSGDSADWTYGDQKITYSFAVELRDKGDNGFVLPAKEIVPSCEESWAGLQYLLGEIAKLEGGK